MSQTLKKTLTRSPSLAINPTTEKCNLLVK